jgi:hypothetical protein
MTRRSRRYGRRKRDVEVDEFDASIPVGEFAELF